jgi:hypothetical protein
LEGGGRLGGRWGDILAVQRDRRERRRRRRDVGRVMVVVVAVAFGGVVEVMVWGLALTMTVGGG